MWKTIFLFFFATGILQIIMCDTFLVVTRLSHEAPYLDAFIDWYLKLGFDKIMLILNDKVSPDLMLRYQHAKDVIVVENFYHEAEGMINMHMNEIKCSGFDWMFHVDSDEFLILDGDKYNNNIQNYTTSAALQYPGYSIDVHYFHWALIKYPKTYCPNVSMYELQKSVRFAASVEVKSMTRIARMESYFFDHTPILLPKPAPGPIDEKYRKQNIDAAGPIAYVHGELSNSLAYEFPTHGYEDIALVHFRVRSLANLVIKAVVSTFESRRRVELLFTQNVFDYDSIHQILGYRAHNTFKEWFREIPTPGGFRDDNALNYSLLPLCHPEKERKLLKKVLLRAAHESQLNLTSTEVMQKFEAFAKVIDETYRAEFPYFK